MIGYLDNKKFSVNNICKDNNAKILIIKVEIETETFILVNLCNSNSDTEQLSDADLLLSDFSLDNKKTIDFAGDFNLFFNQKIEVASKHPVLKKRTIWKILKIIGKYDLIYTLWVRDPSGFIQRRLDYVFISNSIQESAQNPSFFSDHLLSLLSHKNLPHSNLGKNFEKFNYSLIHDELHVLKTKKHIAKIINLLDSDSNHKMKWEL